MRYIKRSDSLREEFAGWDRISARALVERLVDVAGKMKVGPTVRIGFFSSVAPVGSGAVVGAGGAVAVVAAGTLTAWRSHSSESAGKRP